MLTGDSIETQILSQSYAQILKLAMVAENVTNQSSGAAKQGCFHFVHPNGSKVRHVN